VTAANTFVGKGLWTNVTPGTEFITVQGIFFVPDSLTTPGAVFSKATVWVDSVFTNSVFRDNNIASGCASVGACVAANGAGGSIALEVDGSNAVVFDNNNIGGLCLGTPLLVNGANQSLEFKGGAIQFPGFAQFVEDINANGGLNTHDINHFGVHYEQCATSSMGGNAQTAEEPCTISSMATHLGIDPATVVRTVDSLEKRGLVERRRSREDRRQVFVEFTAAGRAARQQAHRQFVERIHAIFLEMSADGQTSLMRGLQEFVQVGLQPQASHIFSRY
jgi:DNA-binding MarR family transcriptional regulator